jgi:hypothetical protein
MRGAEGTRTSALEYNHVCSEGEDRSGIRLILRGKCQYSGLFDRPSCEV